jgi:hypothetical protein
MEYGAYYVNMQINDTIQTRKDLPMKSIAAVFNKFSGITYRDRIVETSFLPDVIKQVLCPSSRFTDVDISKESILCIIPDNHPSFSLVENLCLSGKLNYGLLNCIAQTLGQIQELPLTTYMFMFKHYQVWECNGCVYIYKCINGKWSYIEKSQYLYIVYLGNHRSIEILSQYDITVQTQLAVIDLYLKPDRTYRIYQIPPDKLIQYTRDARSSFGSFTPHQVVNADKHTYKEVRLWRVVTENDTVMVSEIDKITKMAGNPIIDTPLNIFGNIRLKTTRKFTSTVVQDDHIIELKECGKIAQLTKQDLLTILRKRLA